MSRWERWCFNAANALLALSGGAYFYMKHLLETDDPFALVNHPWQPAMLAIHVAVAPVGMMLFGIVFRSHILRKLASTETRARASGWASLTSFLTMAASGYLLQIVAQPAWLRALVLVHVASSIVFGLGYGAHLLAWWRRTPALRTDGVRAEPPGSVSRVRFRGGAAALVLLCAPAAESAPPAPARASVTPAAVVRQAYLMGTRVTVASRAPRAAGHAALERMLRELEATEAELSTWRHDSLLSRLNRQPVGDVWTAPEGLCALLAELSAWQRATGGAFDPGVGALIEAWGLQDGGRRPSPAALARARRRSGLEHVGLDPGPCRVTRRGDVILDAGAFGKGVALDRVAEAETRCGGAAWMADLGGQVAVGASQDAPWTVDLAHPARRDEVALGLRLHSGSLATSGGSERDVVVDGVRLGHVLDPRTGLTVSRQGSVAVWHERALIADVLSTALYVMGPGPGLEWAEARGVSACFLLPGEHAPGIRVRATRSFRELFLDGKPETAQPALSPDQG